MLIGFWKGYLTTFPVTSPCNLPNAINDPVNVTAPINTDKTIVIPVDNSNVLVVFKIDSILQSYKCRRTATKTI